MFGVIFSHRNDKGSLYASDTLDLVTFKSVVLRNAWQVSARRRIGFTRSRFHTSDYFSEVGSLLMVLDVKAKVVKVLSDGSVIDVTFTRA